MWEDVFKCLRRFLATRASGRDREEDYRTIYFGGRGGLRIISCDTYFLYRSRAETLGPGVGIWAKVAVERSNQRR